MYTCTRSGCGETRTEAVAKLGHIRNADPVIENETEASENADGGYEKTVYCPRCGEELSRYSFRIPATGHAILAYGECGNYSGRLVWTFDAAGVLTISGEGCMKDYIEKQGALSATIIATEKPWHEFEAQIKTVEVMEGVKSISPYAFRGLPALEKAVIADSVSSVGEKFITDCPSLTELTVPATLGGLMVSKWGYPSSAGWLSNLPNLKYIFCTGSQEEWSANGWNLWSPLPKGVAIHYSATGHIWDDGVVTTAATTETEGVKTFTCTTCGAARTESIPKALAKLTVTAANVSSGIKLTWTQDANADGYYLVRKTGSGSYTTLKKITSNETVGYVDTTAESGLEYTYGVRSGRGTEKGSFTLKKIVCLAAVTPTLANGKTGMTVKWTKVEGADGYYVFRKSGSGSYTTLKKIESAETLTYTDKTAVSGTKYTYGVRAYKSTTKGAYTAKTMTRLAAITPMLTNAADGVSVKWTQVAGAEGYYIYRKAGTGSYSLVKKIGSGASVSYTDTAVKDSNGTKYTYYVRAYKGATKGAYTAKSIYRLTGVRITKLTNSAAKTMTVGWTDNANATGYQIQYAASSDFSGAKTVTLGSAELVSTAIAKLTKGNTYYVKVRAYRSVSDTNYYSSWSAAKSVKISK
ncbi:MAG: fibronectin type III domain-containing protein, partial [Clostridia bacterium]|nr:fibronectin type III domain-containing protein [Clostridia bacterium]